jgi:hypothetical protein
MRALGGDKKATAGAVGAAGAVDTDTDTAPKKKSQAPTQPGHRITSQAPWRGCWAFSWKMQKDQ